MSRKRWVYTSGGKPLPEPVEVSDDWRNTVDISHRSEAEIYGDLVTTDGTALDSRRKHREYMKEHGFALADDYAETWKKATKERREAAANGGTPTQRAERRADIIEAMQRLEHQPRRR